MRHIAIATVLLLASLGTGRAGEVSMYAAGSLTDAMTELSAAYTRVSGVPVGLTFGASGLLRERIEKGEPAQVFASADLGHPRRLVAEGKAESVVHFTANQLCAIAEPSIGLTTANFLDKVLDPSLKVATSTPKADPGGDYTWMAFAKAEALHPGAEAILKAKALQLVGGPNAERIPAGRNVAAYLLSSGKADIFIAYCTTGRAAVASGAGVGVVQLPEALEQRAEYGLTVLKGASAEAGGLALFILSEAGQDILAKWGFEAGRF